MAELALEGVSKIFPGHVAAVQDLNLTIQDQELIVLVGPSGCGKTTTLRLIAGLDDLSHGVIRINGQSVNQTAPQNRNIAMVFQHSALYPHLTVYNNIAFGLQMRRGRGGVRKWWTRIRHPASAERPRWKQAIAEEVRHASRILGVEHLLDRMPRELSGGERQRVALGRAIVRQPAAFLLDEPFSHLDPQSRGELRRQLKQLLQRRGATTVYVTHDQAEAMSLGDRIVVMQQGRVQQIGRPGALYERPANLFVARFLGEPKMNVVRARRGGAGSESYLAGGGLSMQLSGQPSDWWKRDSNANRDVVVGIRPEHIHLVEIRRRPSQGRQNKGKQQSELGKVAAHRVADQDASRKWKCSARCRWLRSPCSREVATKAIRRGVPAKR